MKLLSLILFVNLFYIVPTFGQMGILTTDNKLFNLRKEGRFDEAIADINKRIEAQPNNGELYLRRAEFLKLQDKLDEAIADISRGIEIEPENPEFYIARAEYYNLAGDSEAVLKDVQTAASLAPDKTGALIYGANELTRGKQYEENVKLADFYIAHNISSDDSINELKHYAYKIRGENKFALKDYVGALEDSIAAINFISFTGESKNDLSADMNLGKISGSDVILQVTQKYLKNDKRIFNYYNQLFDALDKRTEISVEQSIQRRAKILSLVAPNKSADTELMISLQAVRLERLMINCAELYVEKGQPEKGIELFERIVELKLPNKLWRYAKRADFYINLKKYREAIDDLTVAISDGEKISKLYPSYVLYLIKRGRLYEFTKQFDKAIADYEAVKTISKSNENAMNEMITTARQRITENANQPK